MNNEITTADLQDTQLVIVVDEYTTGMPGLSSDEMDAWTEAYQHELNARLGNGACIVEQVTRGQVTGGWLGWPGNGRDVESRLSDDLRETIGAAWQAACESMPVGG
jgi:hypothetical protein